MARQKQGSDDTEQHRLSQDWLPTRLAAAGELDTSTRLLEGHRAGEKTCDMHTGDYKLLPCLIG
jgi:arylsulfatase